jgi:hypothetical protein
MVKEIEVYQFNNISPHFLFRSYVAIWFAMVDHYLCQSELGLWIVVHYK